MSIYSCNISNVSRAKGSSSCATLSYITGEKVHEERCGKSYSYGREERVLYFDTILPKSAPEEFKDSKRLFNSIENFEKADNARTGKKIMVALPKEFDFETQKKVLEEYIIQNIRSQGYACTYAIHGDSENRNPHAHILIANRQINDKGEWGNKRKMVYAVDENGERIPIIDKKTGLQKVDKRNRKQWKRVSVEQNPLDRQEMLNSLREQWAFACNKYLSGEQKIDHRSYEKQGIERVPTIHEGHTARKMENEGVISERCETNRQIKEYNSLKHMVGKMTENIVYELKEKVREINERIRTIRADLTRKTGRNASLDAGAASELARNARGEREAESGDRKAQCGEREIERREREAERREREAKRRKSVPAQQINGEIAPKQRVTMEFYATDSLFETLRDEMRRRGIAFYNGIRANNADEKGQRCYRIDLDKDKVDSFKSIVQEINQKATSKAKAPEPKKEPQVKDKPEQFKLDDVVKEMHERKKEIDREKGGSTHFRFRSENEKER